MSQPAPPSRHSLPTSQNLGKTSARPHPIHPTSAHTHNHEPPNSLHVCHKLSAKTLLQQLLQFEAIHVPPHAPRKTKHIPKSMPLCSGTFRLLEIWKPYSDVTWTQSNQTTAGCVQHARGVDVHTTGVLAQPKTVHHLIHPKDDKPGDTLTTQVLAYTCTCTCSRRASSCPVSAAKPAQRLDVCAAVPQWSRERLQRRQNCRKSLPPTTH